MLDLSPGLTRAEADAMLAGSIPDPTLRGFLLQNWRPGAASPWRIGLAEIAGAMPDVEGWDPAAATYAGATLFVAGETSEYIRPQHRDLIRGLFPAARFVTLRHAGHWLHADNPAGFVSIVRTFLAARL
jgi:esterase